MRVNTQFQNSIGINTLSLDQVEELHLATLEVLERVGVNFFYDQALELFKQKGARVDGHRAAWPGPI